MSPELQDVPVNRAVPASALVPARPLALLAALSFACVTPQGSVTTPQVVDAAQSALPAPSGPEANADVRAAAEAQKPGTPGPDEDVVEIDFNNDARPDVYKFFAKSTAKAPGAGGDAQGGLVRKEADLNRDGRLDLWSWYGRDGVLERQSYDLDFDGRVDVVVFYEKGVIIRKEFYHAFAERPDTFKYYEKGKLQRIERDRFLASGSEGTDGKIDTWEYWEGDQIDRIGEDKNGDGNVDLWIKKGADKK
jgi:hypothetical protein